MRHVRNRMLLFAVPAVMLVLLNLDRLDYGAVLAPVATAAALLFLQAAMWSATIVVWTDAARTGARAGWGALTVTMALAALVLTVTAVERSIGPERQLEPPPPSRSDVL